RLVRRSRFSRLQELQRLDARLITEHLTLQVRRDGEDFQPQFPGQVHPLAGIRCRPRIAVTAPQIQFPARLLPSIETRIADELQPLSLRHTAELPAHQPDLMVRGLAKAMPIRRLFEAHSSPLSSRGRSLVQCW